MWWDQGILCSCAYYHMSFATEWLLVWDDIMLNDVLLDIMQLYWNFVGRKGKPVSKICGNSNQGKSLPLPGSEGYNVVNLSSIGCLVSLMDGLSGIVPGLTLNILCPGSPLQSCANWGCCSSYMILYQQLHLSFSLVSLALGNSGS